MKRDPLGLAVSDFWRNKIDSDITVHSDICEDDTIKVSYLFRSHKDMPALEKKALLLAKGSILDVGSAAGSHALALQKKGLQVTALEVSSSCAEVMKSRGVQKVICEDFYTHNGFKYDTIICLMNGIGIAASIENLPRFFTQLKSLLTPQGQVLIDSSDLRYLIENEDGSLDIDLNADYYGEVNFQMEYEGVAGEWFKWLYLDKESFRMYAEMFGFSFEIVMDGEHYDFLARLSLK